MQKIGGDVKNVGQKIGQYAADVKQSAQDSGQEYEKQQADAEAEKQNIVAMNNKNIQPYFNAINTYFK